jgi:hypothetical protein
MIGKWIPHAFERLPKKISLQDGTHSRDRAEQLHANPDTLFIQYYEFDPSGPTKRN